MKLGFVSKTVGVKTKMKFAVMKCRKRIIPVLHYLIR
nr:MAG TPA: hypothetical protein [Caudoviricetes sp.]